MQERCVTSWLRFRYPSTSGPVVCGSLDPPQHRMDLRDHEPSVARLLSPFRHAVNSNARMQLLVGCWRTECFDGIAHAEKNRLAHSITNPSKEVHSFILSLLVQRHLCRLKLRRLVIDRIRFVAVHQHCLYRTIGRASRATFVASMSARSSACLSESPSD